MKQSKEDSIAKHKHPFPTSKCQMNVRRVEENNNRKKENKMTNDSKMRNQKW